MNINKETMGAFNDMAVENQEKIDPHTGNIKLITGKEAFELFADLKFQEEWDTLYKSCPWATAFQSRAFVSSWYTLFKEKFLPIVVISRSLNGNLSGMLPMAVRFENLKNGKKLKIVGAGEFEAEYQVWLAHHFNRDSFIQSALVLITDQYPKCDILFRYIPETYLLDWIEKDPKWKKKLVVQPFKRPLMKINSPDIAGILKLQRQFKGKYNRLKRLGDVRFERVTELKEFLVILKELMVQFDFRQGAMFNKNQFRDNPLKAELLRELFKQGLLHVTILKVNEEIIASMAAVYDKDWVHLQGLNSHSPFYSKYSPGILHFYLLGGLLVEEQAEVFDLTPGGDHYKERWATDHDMNYTLALTGSSKYYIKRHLKRIVHGWMIKAGLRPMKVELLLEKKLYLFKKKGIKGFFQKPSKNGQFFIYQATLPSKTPVSPVAINKNQVSDLLDYNDSGNAVTRWEFTEKSMADLGEGKNVYTYSSNGELLACIWESQNPSKAVQGQKISSLPDKAHVLLDLYCHGRFTDKLGLFLQSVLFTISNEEQDKAVYFLMDSHNQFIDQTLEKSGFKALGK